MLIGWLGRHSDYAGQGLGEALLFDAIKTVATAPIGAHAIFADAIDDQAAALYLAFGFSPLVRQPRPLYLPVATASAGNRDLLRAIVENAPGSLDELARITGKAKSNLSRTLKTMEGYGIIRLERGERGRITPKVTYDRVELDIPLTWSQKAS